MLTFVFNKKMLRSYSTHIYTCFKLLILLMEITMHFMRYILFGIILLHTTFAYTQEAQTMTRTARADQIYENFFARKRTSDLTDPELMDILQKNIFADVFSVGELNYQERELITVVALTTLQTLPQLKAHIGAALHVGNTPLSVREAIYQCAPYIGFPKTLNAIAVFNEVMHEKNIQLPLQNATTVTEENRHEKGLEIQTMLYGNEVKKAMQSLPGEYKDAVPDMLTDFCFGDFYTRDGLTIKQRELFALVILTALGAEKQLSAHIVGAMKAGNDKETLLATMVQLIPYIGFANAMTAINLIKDADINNYKPIYEE